MKKLTLLLLFTLFLVAQSGVSQAQLKGLLEKAKNKAKNAKDKLLDKDKLKEKGGGLLDDKQASLDSASFNYAFSLADNTSLIGKSGGSEKSLAISAIEGIADVDDNTKPRYARAMDFNRTGEALYQVKKYNLASFRFFSAVMLYVENTGDGTFENSPLKAFKDKKVRQQLFEDMLRTTPDTSSFTLPDYFAYSKTLDNFSLLMHAKGRYTVAEELGNRALILRKQSLGMEHPATGASLNNMAVLYKDMGKFSQSEEMIEPALEVQKIAFGEESMQYAITLNNKALLYQVIGRYEESKKMMEQCVAIGKETAGKKSDKLLGFQVNLAMLHQDLKEYDKAEAIYLEVIDDRKKGFSFSQNEADGYLLNHLATLYMEMGKTAEAGGYLTEATEIYKKKLGENHPAYASVLRSQSKYYRFTNDLDKAWELSEQVVAIRKEVLGIRHPDYLEAREDQAIILWEQGKNDKAVVGFQKLTERRLELTEGLFPAMNEYEKGKYWDKVSPKMMLFYNFAIANVQKYPNLASEMFTVQVKTKGILLNSTARVKSQIMNGTDEKLKQQYIEWLDQKEQLALYYTYSQEDLKAEGISLDSLEKASHNSEKELVKLSADFAESYQFPKTNFDLVKSQLQKDEAAIELIRISVFDKIFIDKVKYVALITTANRATPQLVVLDNGNDLEEKYTKFYRKVVTNKIEDKISYGQFWNPIQQKLIGISKVYLSSDGVYNQIGINTLQHDINGKYVLEMLDIVSVSSTRQIEKLKKPKSEPKKRDVFMLGFPYYGSKGAIAPLPGTKKEIEAISVLFQNYDYDTKVLMEKEASEANFKALINNQQIVYFATHGFFLDNVSQFEDKVFGVSLEKAKENPMLRSGLMFYNAESAMEESSKQLDGNNNGILTAYEVANIPNMHGTELVVLSACETGLGEIKSGEGVYGLQRAFQVAGAKSILMSLWQVSDEATQELMINFSKNWLQSGNKVSAFKQAQLQLKAKYPEPYYWGAFVLLN